MLRDMTDSKRIDGHVQSQKAVSIIRFPSCVSFIFIIMVQSTVHPTIISRHFWPPLESSNIVMPGQFQKYVPALSQVPFWLLIKQNAYQITERIRRRIRHLQTG